MEIFTHLYTFLHPLMWVFFCLECVKFVFFLVILDVKGYIGNFGTQICSIFVRMLEVASLEHPHQLI